MYLFPRESRPLQQLSTGGIRGWHRRLVFSPRILAQVVVSFAGTPTNTQSLLPVWHTQLLVWRSWMQHPHDPHLSLQVSLAPTWQSFGSFWASSPKRGASVVDPKSQVVHNTFPWKCLVRCTYVEIRKYRPDVLFEPQIDHPVRFIHAQISAHG